eukprot:NODE_25072_length_600_cov_5.801268.p2 GENE.NODE_25072_length_600_cov_5.801268~~NODE_25072_length_600_cov_5.801268.p2  ORF type:complete len:65 (-),score=4.00 NODE_25072_length_600_cov_5.801268:1-195(-)
MNAIAAQAIPTISTFKPQARANTAWSCATCLCGNLLLRAAIASAARPMLTVFSLQQLARTAWSM